MSGRRVRVLNVLSHLEQSKMFELIARHVDLRRLDFRVLFLNPPHPTPVPLAASFEAAGIPVESWSFRGYRDYPRTLARLTAYLRRERIDAVHAHLAWASYVAMPAAFAAAVPVRMLTRHHGDEHHRAHPGWVKCDRLASWFATRVITPGVVTHRIVTEWERVPPRKVRLLPLPVDAARFRSPSPAAVEAVRREYNPDGRYPVIGVIARWVEGKGIQHVIPAFERLLADYPDALLLLFNAEGDYAAALERQLQRLPARSFRAVPFDPRNEALYRLFDIFVHVPVGRDFEGFGYVYCEALMAGVPSIFTLSGLVTGRVEHLKHCYVVPHADPDAIYEGLRTLAGDRELAQRLRAAARLLLGDEFDPATHVAALEQLYSAASEAHAPLVAAR